MTKKAMLLFGLLAGLTTASNATDYLVRNGKAVGEFVISEKPSKAVLFSVSDVRRWIHEITGANVPILRKSSSKKNTKVFVGKIFAGNFKKDLEKLKGTDGYAIRKSGGDVHIFGDRPRGTLFGVYAFLEENSDLIFARQNEVDGTIFGKSPDFKLTNCDILSKPVFPIRSMGGYLRGVGNAQLWYFRNGLNETGYKLGADLDMVTHYGDIPYWWMRQKYFKSDPDIFAYSSKYGKRITSGLCYMNPKLDDIYFKGLMERIKAREKTLGRKVDYILSHMGDSWTCCECPLCEKPIKLADGSFLKMKDPSPYKDKIFRSTQYYMFYSRILKRLKKVRPDIGFCVLAYIYSCAAPAVKPDPDLQIIFCPYPTSNQHFALADERQSKWWRENYLKWLTLTKRFGMREYYFLNTIAPLSYTAKKDLLAYMEKQDAAHLMVKSEIIPDVGPGSINWDLAAMQEWIIARLFWDPRRDVEKLRDRYITRTYREAAPQMRKYYDMVRDSWLDPNDKTFVNCHCGNYHVFENVIVKKGLEKKCLRTLKDAMAAAKEPKIKVLISRKYKHLAGLSKGIGKLKVARVPEMKEDAGDFDSIQWEKGEEMTRFNRLYLYKKPALPTYDTALKVVCDDENLYVRITAKDDKMGAIKAMPPETAETFPKGDHIELWFYTPRPTYLFAFNSLGAKYDSKNLDKTWDSGWKVKTRRNKTSWEAVLTIPLKSLNLKAGRPTRLKWELYRNCVHKNGWSEETTFHGTPLHYRKFPIVME